MDGPQTPPVVTPNLTVNPNPVPSAPPPEPKRGRLLFTAMLPVIIVLLILGFFGWRILGANRPTEDATTVQEVELNELLNLDKAALDVSDSNRLIVNGQLKANGAFILPATDDPPDPQKGEFYIDDQTGTIRYYDGTRFVTLQASDNVCLVGAADNCGLDVLSTTEVTNLTTQIESDLTLPQDLSVTASPTFNQLTVSSSTLFIGGNALKTASGSSGLTFVLPSVYGSAGQCLTGDGGGNLSFSTCSSGSGTAFVQDGNAFGEAGVLGTTDNFGLNLITNGTTRLAISNTGGATFSGSVDINTNAGIGNFHTTSSGVGLIVGHIMDTQNCITGCHGIASTIINSNSTNTGGGFNAGFFNVISSAGTVGQARGIYVNAASGSITDNYGLFVANQTAGTNNDYGIYVAGADTYALWVDSGATRFDGTLEVQSTAAVGNQASLVPNAILYAKHSFGSTTDCANLGGCYGLVSDLTLNNPTNPGVGTALYGKVTTAAASFNLSAAHGLYIDSAAAGAGSSITSNYGISVQAQTAGSTNNYGIYVAGASGGSGQNYALWVDSGATRLDGTLEVQTLGTADNQTVLCRNNSNQIAACSGVAGSSILQGGNSFSAAMRIGTNDNHNVEFEINNALQLTLTTGGNLQFVSGQDHSLLVQAQTTSNTAGNNLTVRAATGNGSGTGGTLTLLGGTGGSSGVGGAVAITGGAAGGGNTNGGAVTITGGAGSGLSSGGSINITAGTGALASGDINLTTAHSGGSLVVGGGNVFSGLTVTSLTGATATSSNNLGGGAVAITGGGGGTQALAGGSLSLVGGAAGTNGNQNGGNVIIQGGTKNASGTTGIVMVKSLASNNTTTAFQVRDASDNVALNVDTTNLRVGIGRNDPGAKLDVDDSTSSSDVDVFRIITDVGGANNVKFRIDSDGDVFTDGTTSLGNPADVAERYENYDGATPGDVVVITGPTSVAKSTSGYQKGLAGVVSTYPGLILAANTNGVDVALAGRVPVKVTSENGAIQVGDYLTSSDTKPGYAMKATANGPVVGVAMQSHTSGHGVIEVFISNGAYAPSAAVGQSTPVSTSTNVTLGMSTVDELTVVQKLTTGSLVVNGRSELKDVVIRGRIITAGAAPTVSGNGASVEGNDSAGTLTIDSGSVTAGQLATITFRAPRGSTPRVIVTPTSLAAGQLKYHIEKSLGNFSIIVDEAAGTVAGPVKFDYFVLE